MKKKSTKSLYTTVKDHEKDLLKQEIKKIAIPWSRWHYKDYIHMHNFNNLLTSMFFELLNLVKEKKIKISCGVVMMDFLNSYSRYNASSKKIEIAGCEIATELDFNLAKYDMWYDDVILVGKGVPEPNIDYSPCNSNEAFKKVAQEVCPSKKNIWQRIFG